MDRSEGVREELTVTPLMAHEAIHKNRRCWERGRQREVQEDPDSVFEVSSDIQPSPLGRRT